ncbi:MAG: DNA mismatch repair endonuclease MutL [Promethearchaeota archaeon]
MENPNHKIELIKGYEKIAAGEVIERPASVVKELIENSLDAEATQIFLTVKNAGRDLIQVLDNGHGIAEKDLDIAFKRHTSSKIQNADQLDSISTLGFRGEALASMAAVSQIEIISRPANQAYAVKMELEEGENIAKEPCGSPLGTTINVKNLFYNLPVRQKFLRNNKVELGHISDILTRYSLAYPYVHFKLQHNNIIIINSPAWTSPTFKDSNSPIDLRKSILSIKAYKFSLETIYGKKISAQMFPIEYEDERMRIWGYLGKPGVARSEKNAASLFVNRRLVTNAEISQILRDAYKDYLMRHKYPFYVIFLEVSPGDVDFNVHPSKKVVKFVQEQRFFAELQFIFSKIVKEHMRTEQKISNQANLGTKSAIDSRMDYWTPAPTNLPTSPPTKSSSSSIPDSLRIPKSPQKKLPILRNSSQGSTSQKVQTHFNILNPKIKSGSSPNRSSASLPSKIGKTDTRRVLNQVGSEPAQNLESGKIKNYPLDNFTGKSIPVSQLPPLQILNSGIQAGNTYLIFQNEEGLVLIDQHAAHERINLEKVEQMFAEEKFPVQQLVVPMKVDVAPNEVEFTKDAITAMKNVGFEMEFFGGTTFILRTIPAIFQSLVQKKSYSEVFIVDACLEIMRMGKSHSFSEIQHEIMQYMACHMSIRAGDEIWSHDRINRLVKELDSCKNPHHCAHGRPTYIKIPFYELEKWFHRIV